MRAPALVRRTLLANATFSILCALLLLTLSTPLAPHLGLESRTPLVVVALGLVPFALAVGATALRETLGRGPVLAFAAADVAWVIGSALLLTLAWTAIPGTGRILIASVALAVGTFAGLQLYGAGRAVRRPSSRWAEISRSWLSMKGWVKTWLFFLNAVFLLAILFPPQPLTTWILGAYVASGPLLWR